MKNSIFSILFLAMVVSCMNPQPRKPITHKSSSNYLKESIDLNKELNLKEEKAFQELMELDSLNTYRNSSYGFWYKVEFKSDATYFPKKGDELHFSYEVSDLNSEIIYSFDEIGLQKYYFEEQEIISGLREGLKLMNEGDVVTFLFPSHKVFGYLGDQNKIEVNQPLIIKINLSKIKKSNENN
jgi:gliding motility-associated peptidyl-prolyl isomerase